MHISKVESNLKVGVDVEIGEKTLIVGANGSGKSSVINAIELALTGRAGDIAGRVDVGREADVMSLAPPGADHLEALAKFDDGVVAAYRTSGSTAKAKKATGDKPSDRCHEDVLPIRSLREAVLGSATTARKYLLGKVSGQVTRDDVRAMLPEQARELWDKIVLSMPTDMATADVLVGALEDAGKRQRAANDEAKSARNAAKLVSGSFASPPGEAEIKAAKAARNAAREEMLRADRYAGREASLAKLREKAIKAVAAQERAAAALEAATASLESQPPEPKNLAVLKDALLVNAASVECGACLVCGSDAGDLHGMHDSLEGAIGMASKATQARRAAQDEFDRASGVAEAANDAVTDLEQELGRILESADDEEVLTVEEAKAALDVAQSALSELEAARDNWNVVQRSESIAVDAERKAESWKTLKTACEEAVGLVLDRAVAAFIGQVQSSLPATDVFDLRLRDGDREVVQFGLVRHGHLHTALSGAEWARVMAAMAEACVPAGQYACVIPEERAFDPKTLSAVLTALSGCRHQVVIASPVMPSPVPKGWTVIKRGT